MSSSTATTDARSPRAVSGGRRVPPALWLWSSRAPDFKGKNDEVLKILMTMYTATGGRDMAVYDQGGDRPTFHGYFTGEGRDFIVRLKDRSVLPLGGVREVRDLTRQCTMRHSHHVTLDSHGRECNVLVSFGAILVRLQGTTSHRRQGLQTGSDDTARIVSRGRLVQVTMVRRRGLSLVVEDRGNDSPGSHTASRTSE